MHKIKLPFTLKTRKSGGPDTPPLTQSDRGGEHKPASRSGAKSQVQDAFKHTTRQLDNPRNDKQGMGPPPPTYIPDPPLTELEVESTESGSMIGLDERSTEESPPQPITGLVKLDPEKKTSRRD